MKKLEQRGSALHLALLAFSILAAFIINNFYSAISPLFITLILGLLISNTLGWGDKKIADLASKRALRLGVIFLGFQISLSQLVDIGVKGIAAVALVVSVTFFGVRAVNRRLQLSDRLSLYIAGGFAICGATAIAALSSTVKPSQENRERAQRDLSYAVAIVALCGTLSIFFLPLVIRFLGLSPELAGAWIGAAVHDVGQVVATADLIDEETTSAAIIVKLTRVVALIPLMLFIAHSASRLIKDEGVIAEESSKSSIIKAFPVFVALFLLTALFVNTAPISQEMIELGKSASKLFLAIGLFGMGVGVKWQSIKSLGARPLLIGIALWIASASLALAIVALFGF
jgi:uncharacterized integral membrane protein (TIGR00698 family)